MNLDRLQNLIPQATGDLAKDVDNLRVALHRILRGSVRQSATVTTLDAQGDAAFQEDVTIAGTLQVTGVTDLDGRLDLNSGQIVFPATQNASSGANTLDDYEEDVWTPTLTFATPGDLNVAYSATGRHGSYTKIGRLVVAQAVIVTTTFTHSTASGALQVTGLPFTAANVNDLTQGSVSWQGVTKANYTHLSARVGANTTTVVFDMSGSAQNRAGLTTADLPTGGSVILSFTVTYRV